MTKCNLSLLKSWFSQLNLSLPQVCQSNLHGSSPLEVSGIRLKVTGRKMIILKASITIEFTQF